MKLELGTYDFLNKLVCYIKQNDGLKGLRCVV